MVSFACKRRCELTRAAGAHRGLFLSREESTAAMGGPAQHGFARPQSDRYSIAVRIGRLLMSPLFARDISVARRAMRVRGASTAARRVRPAGARGTEWTLYAPALLICFGIVAELGGVAFFIIHLMRARRDPHTNTLRTHVLQPATDGRAKRAACSTTRWTGARFVGSSVRSVGGAAGLAWESGILRFLLCCVGLGRLPG